MAIVHWNLMSGRGTIETRQTHRIDVFELVQFHFLLLLNVHLFLSPALSLGRCVSVFVFYSCFMQSSGSNAGSRRITHRIEDSANGEAAELTPVRTPGNSGKRISISAVTMSAAQTALTSTTAAAAAKNEHKLHQKYFSVELIGVVFKMAHWRFWCQRSLPLPLLSSVRMSLNPFRKFNKWNK